MSEASRLYWDWMGMSNFDDVGRFHEKFGLHSVTTHGAGPVDKYDTDDLIEFRVDFMREELNEFIEAADLKDDAGMFDALIDLVYVAMGTAHLLGFPWHEGWREVQRTNMLKERATSQDMSKRRSEFDVVKPEGWTPPQLEEILAEHGF